MCHLVKLSRSFSFVNLSDLNLPMGNITSSSVEKEFVTPLNARWLCCEEASVSCYFSIDGVQFSHLNYYEKIFISSVLGKLRF